MEALAAGKVCVASDATGADDVLVDGSSAFVVPQGDATALATALRRALSLSDDERQRMQAAAQQQAEALDWGPIAERHAAFLLDPFRPRR
jgi:glycosyltransferase involved in cell wall biosynthesis